MQPAASGLDGTGVKLMKGEVMDVDGMVNDPKFLKRRVEDVPVDQASFLLHPSLGLSDMLTYF
jgi:ribosome biogenesis protein MAK21